MPKAHLENHTIYNNYPLVVNVFIMFHPLLKFYSMEKP